MKTNLSKLIELPCGSGVSAPTYEQELKAKCMVGWFAERKATMHEIESTILLISKYMKDKNIKDYDGFIYFLAHSKLANKTSLSQNVYGDEVIREIKQLKGELK